MLALRDLPRLRAGTRAMYEGSIDKRGGNADWDWWLYQDARGEWTIFDVDGPGCIYNFVQHRYPSTPQPTFRFYFDGETEPRFEITPEQFGGKAPFIEPLAGYFLGDDAPPRGRGPIRVVRSFVPMPFRKSCRITSSIQLIGNDRTKGEGGWGHVIYHTFASAEGVETFTGRESIGELLNTYSEMGKPPALLNPQRGIELAPGATEVWLDRVGSGVIEQLVLRLLPYDPALLSDLWITMRWDGHETPDIDAPIGAFFGNEYGLRPIGLLLYGQTSDGRFYARLPMPFWESAKIEISNRGKTTARLTCSMVVEQNPFDRNACGYLRSTKYYPLTPATPDRDSTIGEATGRGHIVAATVTGRSIGDSKYVSCEGDVRLYLDGNATPQIDSDGSESHVGYGWGFVSPGQQNPVSGYDGSGEPTCEFSETRSHPGDVIPFQTGFRFGIEAGEENNYPMQHSGLIVYYGIDTPGMTLTDTLNIGDAASEAAHQYSIEQEIWHGQLESAYEGDFDDVRFANTGRAFSGRSSFMVKIEPKNNGVRLRLRMDQELARHRARVIVDDRLVEERTWYVADRNPHFRWLDTEFDIPATYTAGKSSVAIAVERVARHPDGVESPPWNEFRYEIFSLL